MDENTWRGIRIADKTDADYLAYWKSKCIINPVTGCWEWQGFCFKYRNQKPGTRGYAASGYRRAAGARLSRLIAGWNIGRTLLKTEVAMHLCDNPPCINPEHLTVGTQEQNKLDEVAKGRSFYANKTHCKRGHPFDEQNTRHELGKKGRPRRACIACQLGHNRIAHGWPEHLAFSMPAQTLGYRPPEVRAHDSQEPQDSHHG